MRVVWQVGLGGGQGLGVPHGACDIGKQQVVDPTPHYILVRSQVAILGTATALLTYFTAKRLLDVKTGLVSALIMAVAFLHVRDSHFHRRVRSNGRAT